MSNNISSTQLTLYKNDIVNDMTNLYKALSSFASPLTTLSTISASYDDSKLSQSFKDLSYMATQAGSKLNTFKTTFNTNMAAYIKTVVEAEKKVTDELKKNTDQFREIGDQIKAIK